MNILICGSRYWYQIEVIEDVLTDSPTDSLVIHGAAKGADSLGGTVAKRLGMQVKEYPADWKKYGFSAGPRRNRQMIKENRVDLVLAFNDDLRTGAGTRDMVNYARSQGIEVINIDSKGNRKEIKSYIRKRTDG